MRRHAGVLGLSACILSSPYQVPVWMPHILMELSHHLNDPQPIEVLRPPGHLTSLAQVHPGHAPQPPPVPTSCLTVLVFNASKGAWLEV